FGKRRYSAVLGLPSAGGEVFAMDQTRRNNAGRAGVARPVRIIDDDRAAQALRGAATELGTGQPEILTQEIIHGQIIAHVSRAVDPTVDRNGERGHLSAPLSIAWVTGKN